MTAAAHGSTAPLTDRGRRTRDALLVAARSTFEERGFTGTRMGDVATAAGVSHGTVYTWFDSKEAMLGALVDDMVADLREVLRSNTDVDPVERIALANLGYLEAYQRNARLLEVAEEVATADERFRAQLAEIRSFHVDRVARDITRLQAEGLAVPDLDAHTAAAALCGMVESFARHWFGRGERRDEALAVATLTELWTRALGITPDRPRRRSVR